MRFISRDTCTRSKASTTTLCAISHRPGCSPRRTHEIYNNHAGSLKALGRLVEAERYYRRAIELEPGFALAHHNFADLLLKLDRPAEATARCRAALELDPGFAQTYITLGMSLEHQGRYEEAIAAHRESVRGGTSRRRTNSANRCCACSRANGRRVGKSTRRGSSCPRYRRSTSASTIRAGAAALSRAAPLLVAREQGLGDEIMFASCFNEVLDLAGRCFITCHRRLQPLFARSFPKATFLSGPRPSLQERLAGETRGLSDSRRQLAPGVSRRSRANFRATPVICARILRASSTGVPALPVCRARAGSACPGEAAAPGTGYARRSIALEAFRPLLQHSQRTLRQPAVRRRR